MLAQQTDHETIALAWPYGIHTPEAVGLAVDAGFSLLFTTDEAYVAADTPLTALTRINVAADAPRCFREIVDPTTPPPRAQGGSARALREGRGQRVPGS